MKILNLISAAAITLLATTANANLIVNGDFEDPGVAAGTYSVLDTLSGWSLSPNVEVRNALVGNANTGTNYVELDTFNNSSIYQMINTVAGTTYTLAFAYSPRIGLAPGTNGISALVNGVELATVTGQGADDHTWEIFSYNFYATSSLSEVRFTATGVSDGLGGSLDTVSVNAVPVPASAALLAVGLLALRSGRRAK
jgi:hypothetical protein